MAATRPYVPPINPTRCVPQYRAMASGLWHQSSPGSVNAVRCATCNRELVREDGEPSAIWNQRCHDWWTRHQSAPGGRPADTIVMPFFEWGGGMYPVICDLPHRFKLVAHKNCPAITDGEMFCTLNQHEGDHPEMIEVKREATMRYIEWSWKHLGPRTETPVYIENMRLKD